ncbi:MAG: sulfatase-like hydrolase/transferase [Verrucomicrobia bacterium]|nr:sulfatase-like hydrolase/transferase [Verrucomicrobiota bacterium]
MRRAKLALQAGTLKGILWHQGESDAKRDLAPAYAAKLADLVARLRQELDAPAVPFIAGQLGKFADSPWDEFKQQIDRTLRDLPAKVPRTAFVSAEGLNHKGDKIHFDADSYRELGRRYAAAYLQLARASALTFTAPPRPPNIIYILADDLGYGDLGCYGQKKFATPNIDRLAREGMRFTSFYSGNTVCAPSRSALLTGQHTGHTPVRGNAEIFPEGQEPLPAAAVTIPEVLRGAGYVSGAFGKWGLGFVGSEGDPTAQGFDRFFGYNCQRFAHRYYPPYLWDGQRQVFLPGNDMHVKTTYAPDILHRETLKFIRTHREKPFFLFVPTPIPHAELQAPDDEILAQFKGKFPETPFAGRKFPEWGGEADYGPDAAPGGYASQPMPRSTFAAMVTRLDRQVGEILRLLDELGIAQDTLVLFTSDNGPHTEGGHDPEFFDSNGPLRGVKRDLYEGGIRVPLLARWPARIAAGRVVDAPFAAWDILPTLAELGGAKLPAAIDGLSLVPTLLGQPGQKEHEYFYWEFRERGPTQAVRADQWKAIHTFAAAGRPATFELYDLSADLGETRNIAAAHPQVVERLRRYLNEAHQPNPRFPLPCDP